MGRSNTKAFRRSRKSAFRTSSRICPHPRLMSSSRWKARAAASAARDRENIRSCRVSLPLCQVRFPPSHSAKRRRYARKGDSFLPVYARKRRRRCPACPRRLSSRKILRADRVAAKAVRPSVRRISRVLLSLRSAAPPFFRLPSPRFRETLRVKRTNG